VTLKRWIKDNKEYLERCFHDQTGQKGPGDYYDDGCDGINAKDLYEKLVDLISTDPPLVRRFDDDINGYHIVCTENGRQDHCNFTANFVP
jgi:hypothetical protein